jgi:hypothetical protein
MPKIDAHFNSLNGLLTSEAFETIGQHLLEKTDTI